MAGIVIREETVGWTGAFLVLGDHPHVLSSPTMVGDILHGLFP